MSALPLTKYAVKLQSSGMGNVNRSWQMGTCRRKGRYEDLRGSIG